MNRKTLFFILIAFSFILVHCGNRSNKEIKNRDNEKIIDYDVMVNLLIDCYLTEGKLFTAVPQESKREYTHYFYRELFQKYAITDYQFQISIDYYLREKETAEAFMEEVTMRLNYLKDSIQKIDEPCKQD